MSRLRVLIVDDEVSFAHALRRVLHRTHDVEVLGDGALALAAIMAGQRFDVILSDVSMPKMTGVELLEQLVTHAPDQARHFVFLTGGVFPERTEQRIRALGTRQLEKPVDLGELRSTISEVAAEALDRSA
jgi:CheY-like chemotaxis protein